MNPAREAAAFYLSLGWVPVPIPYRDKGPKGVYAWQTRTWAEARALFEQDFPATRPCNVGVVLGQTSGRLFDIDLDCPEAIAFADLLLPRTTFFGRAGARRAHRLYVGDLATEQFLDPSPPLNTKPMIIEIRSDGGNQTVFPGSAHRETGELIEWGDAPLPPVSPDLVKLKDDVHAIAGLSCIARHWPKQDRRLCHLALAAVLLRLKWSPELVTEVLCVVSMLDHGEEEREKRERAVRTTATKLQAGDRAVSWGTLAKHINRKSLSAARKWLGADRKPVIAVVPNLDKMISMTVDAITGFGFEEPERRIFKRGDRLVRVIRTDKPPSENAPIRRQVGTPYVSDVTQTTITRLADAAADFISITMTKKGEEKHKKVLPPPFIAEHLLDQKSWPEVDHFELFTETPIFLSNGTVLQTPGYHEESGIIYEPRLVFPHVPEYPSTRDVQEALDVLRGPFAEFPFEDEMHRTSLYAAFLTPLAVQTFESRSPLFLFEAAERSSGKSFLAKMCGIIGTGMIPPASTFAEDAVEMRKRITTHLLAGDRVVVFDNVDKTLGGAPLCIALTETHWQDRLLGGNADYRGPISCTFYATANNCEIGPDMDRRILPIRLNANCEKPEDREFKIKDIVAHTVKHRPELVTAALTLLRAYHAASRPEVQIRPWPSCESWTRAVLAPLVWLGFRDPTPTQQAMVSAEIGSEHRKAFVAAFATFVYAEQSKAHAGGKPIPMGVTASRVSEAIKIGEPALREALEGLVGAKGQISAIQVSGVMRRLRQRVIAGMKIVHCGEDPVKRISWWAVQGAA